MRTQDVKVSEEQVKKETQGEKVPEVQVKDGKVSLKSGLYEAAAVLQQIADKANISLVYASQMPKVKVRIALVEVSPEDAVDVIASAAGWQVIKHTTEHATVLEVRTLTRQPQQIQQMQPQPQTWIFWSLLVGGAFLLVLLESVTVALLCRSGGFKWMDVLPLGVISLLLAFIVWAIVRICQPE